MEEVENSKDYSTHYSQIQDTNELKSSKNIHKLREMRYKEQECQHQKKLMKQASLKRRKLRNQRKQVKSFLAEQLDEGEIVVQAYKEILHDQIKNDMEYASEVKDRVVLQANQEQE